MFVSSLFDISTVMPACRNLFCCINTRCYLSNVLVIWVLRLQKRRLVLVIKHNLPIKNRSDLVRRLPIPELPVLTLVGLFTRRKL